MLYALILPTILAWFMMRSSIKQYFFPFNLLVWAFVLTLSRQPDFIGKLILVFPALIAFDVVAFKCSGLFPAVQKIPVFFLSLVSFLFVVLATSQAFYLYDRIIYFAYFVPVNLLSIFLLDYFIDQNPFLKIT